MSALETELSYSHIRGLFEFLKNLNLEKPSVSLVYGISKNLLFLEKEYQLSEDVKKIKDSELLKRDKLRLEDLQRGSLEIARIAGEYSEIDLENPKIKSLVVERQKQLQLELKLKIEKEYKDVIEEYDRIQNEYEEFLKTKTKVRLYLLPISKLPQNFETTKDVMFASLIINPEQEE